jgi:transketolase
MSKDATRNAYGRALAELVKERPDVVVLDADLSKSTKTFEAKKADPSRHFNMGIAEGNMMGVAAGLAASGKTVFASSFAMFATGRAFEQIRNSIGYPHLNVKVAATHAGLTVGEDGATHQSIEDLALMRLIPGMTVFCPCDQHQAFAAVKAAADIQGPVYIRLGRGTVEDVYANPEEAFVPGKGKILRQGKGTAVVATGMMVQEALKAADILHDQGMDITVADISTLKPIDEELLVQLAKTHDLIVTAEEHSIIGGLAGAVSECLSEKQPVRIKRVGVKDTYGESGTPEALKEKYGLNAKAIVQAVTE